MESYGSHGFFTLSYFWYTFSPSTDQYLPHIVIGPQTNIISYIYIVNIQTKIKMKKNPIYFQSIITATN